MRIVDIKDKLPVQLLTHEMLSSLLDVSNKNEKISNLVKKREIIRLKKGYYLFPKIYTNEDIDHILVANSLYPNSFVSFRYALEFHEVVRRKNMDEVKSITIRNDKSFDTEIGKFSYKKVPMEIFNLGVDWVYDEKYGGKFVASVERAISDEIKFMKRDIKTQKDMLKFLENELEFDISKIEDLNMIDKLSKLYNSRRLKLLFRLLSKYKNRDKEVI